MPAEQGHDVVHVAPCRPHVHQERWLARQPQAAGGDKGRLDTVGLTMPQRHRNRSRGRAGTFEIPPQRVDEVLDPFRSSQAAEPDGEGLGKAQPEAEGHSSGRATVLAEACYHGQRLPPRRPPRNRLLKARQAAARPRRME